MTFWLDLIDEVTRFIWDSFDAVLSTAADMRIINLKKLQVGQTFCHSNSKEVSGKNLG